MRIEKKRSILVLTSVLIIVVVVSIAVSLFRMGEVHFVSKLNAGFNLSNTLDSHGIDDRTASPHAYETFWGNPITTSEMIKAVKDAGFQTVRVPVTWYEHMDDNYMIDSAWMSRVNEVVDYCIENELYVIVNAHHDDWYSPFESNREKAAYIMKRLWKQIAERFADYDEKLLFESMNEPRLIDTVYEWNEGTKQAREIVNDLNEVFVEAVRSSGGYNSSRYLLIPTYCASTKPAALKDFVLPDSERLIVSLHLYRPYEFALCEEGTAAWDSSEPMDTYEIDQAINDARIRFVEKGIPVMITEFGAYDKHNTKERAAWADYVMQKCAASEIPCIWWDDSIFDRRTLQWIYPQITKVLTKSR